MWQMCLGVVMFGSGVGLNFHVVSPGTLRSYLHPARHARTGGGRHCARRITRQERRAALAETEEWFQGWRQQWDALASPTQLMPALKETS